MLPAFGGLQEVYAQQSGASTYAHQFAGTILIV
jgi:hypothetical protein